MIYFVKYDTHKNKIHLCIRSKDFCRNVMQQNTFISYNIGPAGPPQFVFAVVNVYRDTILAWHATIGISCGLYTSVPVYLYTPTRNTFLSHLYSKNNNNSVKIHTPETRGPWALMICWKTNLGIDQSSRSCTCTLSLPTPWGSKLSLFSLYGEWFLRYGPIF